MIRKNDISTPEGYFEDLQRRLSAPVSAEEKPGALQRIAPYFAYAAVLAVAVLAGNLFLRKSADSPVEETAPSWEYVSYLAQSMDPDGLVESELTSELTREDIINYLIDNGLSVEYLNLVQDEEGY